MANKDNKLAKTEVLDSHTDDYVKNGADTLEMCWNHQKYMQEKVYGYDFSTITIGEIVDFCMMNKHAIEDEMGEFMDALGGIDDGVGNAAWKPWKSANKEIRSKRIADLTEADKKELKMEFVDMFHFFMNFGIIIGMDAREVYNMYFAKAKENVQRQNNSY